MHANYDFLELWALISNAAVVVCGEFFWQTESHREKQMDVNFWGTINLTTEFKVLLLESKCE